jgi:hypothetical protein
MPLAGFQGRKAAVDVECYPNYVTINFLDLDTGEISRYRLDSDHNIDQHTEAEAHYRSLAVAVGYNTHGYDDHVLRWIFLGLPCEDVYESSNNRLHPLKAALPARPGV